MADQPSIESLRAIVYGMKEPSTTEEIEALDAALSELAAYREREECIAIPEDGVPEHLWLRVGPAAYMALRAERDALKAELDRRSLVVPGLQCALTNHMITLDEVKAELTAANARAAALAARVARLESTWREAAEALNEWAKVNMADGPQRDRYQAAYNAMYEAAHSTPAADLAAHDARVRREALEGAWERVKLHNHNPTGYINVNVIRNAIRGEAIVECGCHLDHKARAAAILGPEPREEREAAAAKVDELAALVRQLVRSLRKHSPDNETARKAMDYLRRHELQGSPLRGLSPAPDAAKPMNGIEAIAAERRRQIEAEGWTPEHDDEHGSGEMAAAAGCYVISAFYKPYERFPVFWPWGKAWWKPKDRRSNLIRAGALIAAEIDRLDRKAAILGPESQDNEQEGK